MKQKRSAINKTESWEEVVKENSYFVNYYKTQKIVNDSDWDRFINILRQQLPLAYRFVGDKEMIRVLVSRMESDFMSMLPDTLPRPFPLSWYPGQVSFQHNISRAEIRSNEVLKDYHLFLLSEADCGNLVRQELVSQIPPLLLEVKPHHVVLDMCASPGSKTSQLIELLHKNSSYPPGCIVANDVNNSRCYTMVHNIKRLGSPCLVVTNHNAMTFPNIEVASNDSSSVKYLMYDRILCDVPCTGDGTLRKNYTIWRRWHSKNGNSLHRLQLSILKRALYLLKPGGRLVYSTCSFNPIENEAVIGAALSFFGTENLSLLDVSHSLPGLLSEPGLQSWAVFGDEQHVFHSFSEYKECTTLPKNIKLQPTLFPSTEDSEKGNFHLERCVRVLPHKQNSGGFFVAVLHKKGHFSSRQQKRGDGFEKSSEKCDFIDGKNENTGQSSGDNNDNSGGNSNKAESPEVGEDDNDLADIDGDTLSFENHKPPPAKQGRFRGLKEDPFIHITNFESDLCVTSLKKDFGVTDSFPFGNLVKRRDTEGGRKVSLTNDICREIVSLNDNSKLKIIHAGTLILERRHSDESDLSFRVVQDGVNLISQHLMKRVLQLPSDDVIQVLREESVPFKLFSQQVQDELTEISCGSVVLTFDASKKEGETKGIELVHSFAFCAWKGRYTLRAYVKACEREHFLRLTGTSLGVVNSAKQAKQEKSKVGESKEECLEVKGECAPEEFIEDPAIDEEDV